MLILPCSLTKNGIQENLQVVIQTVEAQNSTRPYSDAPQRSGFFESLLKEVFFVLSPVSQRQGPFAQLQ